ncbi:MAG: DUF3800 domain-containing protein [Candidatus Komeilibacteria bacterium]|nr:DUF3800 domain-containing protein [Candidatus Komeilibacteria bacterium]
MWYLYLDESGDLGFDFVNKKPSKFFTVTILALSNQSANRQLNKAVKVTLRRKLNRPKHQKRLVQELKGTGTTLEVKKYFYQKVKNIKFGVYSVTLNKKKVFERLTKEKARVYNYIARKVLDQIPFEKNNNDRVELILDRSMAKPEIAEFNSYIRRQLEGRLSPQIPLDIYHWLSHENFGLQAADLFCWGIFQKYERQGRAWYDIFAEKIRLDEPFL